MRGTKWPSLSTNVIQSNFIVAHHLYIHDTKVHYTPDFIRLSYDQNTSFQVNIRFLRVLFLFIDMVFLTFQMLTFYIEIINIKVCKSYLRIVYMFCTAVSLNHRTLGENIILFSVKTFWEIEENRPPVSNSCQRTFFHIFPYNKGWLYFLKTQRNYVMLCSCFLLLWSNLPYFYFNESNLNCHKKTKLLPLHTDDEHKTQRSVNLNIQIDINLYLEIIYTLKYCYNYVDPEC